MRMVYETSATFLALVLLFLVESAQSSPINSTRVSGKEQADVMNYMMNYGYLRQKDPGEMRTKDDLDKGIRELQEFSGLNVTGKIDAETVKMSKKPRCSMPDFGPSDMMKRKKRYALHHTHWKKHDLTYRILNTPTLELTKNQVKITMRKAFDMWSDVSPLTFKEIFVGEADIMISFVARDHGDGHPFYGRGVTIAHAFYPWNNLGEAGDIHFDDDEHWTLNKETVGTNFVWAAVHEIGHAIGLQHSHNPKSIMIPQYPGYEANLKLYEDDIMAIQAKYGPKVVPTTPPTTNPSATFNGPSPCGKSFDAVVHSSDGNTYFFKGIYFWTLDKYKRLLEGRKIVDHWQGLQPNVHAAYTRLDGTTVFFNKRKYWIFKGTKRIAGPQNIADFGLPSDVNRLDAAFIWSANGKAYFFRGNKYWRYNEELKKLDEDYPRKISQGWGAVRYPVNAVLSWSDGNTYFFNGLNYSEYEFRKRHLHTSKRISQFFFKCDERIPLVTDMKNGVFKTSVFAPIVALMAFFASLNN